MSNIINLYRLRLNYTLPLQREEAPGPHMDRADALSSKLMTLAEDHDNPVHGDSTPASEAYITVESENYRGLAELELKLTAAIINAGGRVVP